MMDDEERRQLELEIEQRVRQELEASIDQRLEDQLNQRFQALNLLVGQGNSAQAGDEAGQGEIMQISSVSPKIVNFWHDDPESWLLNMEAQFALSSVVREETKYNYLLTALPSDFQKQIKSFTKTRYEPGKYEKLKEKVIQKYEPSEARTIEQVLDKEEIGDRKPSDFLAHLRCLADTVNLPENILRDRWMRKLPAFVSSILPVAEMSSGTQKTLDELAMIADAIHQRSQDFNITLKADVGQVDSGDRNSRSRRNNNNNRRKRSKSRGRSPSPWRRSRYNPGGALCWHHFMFGTKSHKCSKDDCKWSDSSKNESGGQ